MDAIPLRWLEKARSEIDAYDQFVSAYIAMNYLYGGRSESSELKRFVNCAMEICEMSNVDPFSFEHTEYLADGVLNMHPKHVGERVAVISGDRVSLFSAIYLVRCNLFHGNKDVACERDMRLSAQGGGILIGILTALSHA